MTSTAQELKGYPIPDVINPANTRCIAFTIPDDDAYHRACIAQITLLTKWWNWKRTNPQDAHAKQSAEAFATVLAYSPLDNPIDCALLDGELEMFDCGDVEDCLETSTIVNNIETNITNVSNTVNNHTSEITNLTESITEIVENSDYNEFPEYPNPTNELDNYCGASWALANYLHDLIQDIITDASSITFAEFIVGILPLGGFKTSLVKALWDFVIVNLNPNLSTEVTDALQDVANHFYCNNLLVAPTRQDIIDNMGITSDAEAAYIGAIDSLTTAKYSEIVYIGSFDESQDCSVFTPCNQWYNLMDFSVAPYETIVYAGNYAGGYWESENVGGNSILHLGWKFPKQTFKSAYYDAWKIDHASISHNWSVLLEGGSAVGGGLNNNIRPRQFTLIANSQANKDEFRIYWGTGGLDKQFRLYSMRLSGIGVNPQNGVDVIP